MHDVGGLSDSLRSLRIVDETPREFAYRHARSAHHVGYTGDTAPVGSQWAWARHWIRISDLDEDARTFTDDPEVKRIIHYLAGCAACAFAAPVADDRPDTQELPPDPPWIHWDFPEVDG